jgi:hypothetical protein
MSLSALVYRSRRTLDIDVGSLGAAKDDRTGEYYFPTQQYDGKFPREAFIASEFWIGNITGVAELREELRTITNEQDSLLLKRCLYSGTHSGDVIELALLPTLEHEVRGLLVRSEMQISENLISRNPDMHPSATQVPEGFEFMGYDLLDKESGISALSNCGGFPKAFSNSELSEKGLLVTHERSRTVQDALVREYPDEHHADCHLWAIFRCL